MSLIEELLDIPAFFWSLLAISWLMLLMALLQIPNLVKAIRSEIKGRKQYLQELKRQERLDRKIALASLLMAGEKNSTK